MLAIQRRLLALQGRRRVWEATSHNFFDSPCHQQQHQQQLLHPVNKTFSRRVLARSFSSADPKPDSSSKDDRDTSDSKPSSSDNGIPTKSQGKMPPPRPVERPYWSLPDFSKTSHILSYSSGRARKRRNMKWTRPKRKTKRKKEGDNADDNEIFEDDGLGGAEFWDIHDDRTVGEILFPSHPGITEEDRRRDRQRIVFYIGKLFDYQHMSYCLREAWKQYIETWDGFFTQRGFLVYSKEELAEMEREKQEQENSKLEQIKKNLRRNTRVASKAALIARDKIRKETGIQSTEDLRNFAQSAMQTATETLREFMAGYREGRDQEMENVMTKYFQELEQQHKAGEKEIKAQQHGIKQQRWKRKRRKIKRRQLVTEGIG